MKLDSGIKFRAISKLERMSLDLTSVVCDDATRRIDDSDAKARDHMNEFEQAVTDILLRWLRGLITSDEAVTAIVLKAHDLGIGLNINGPY